MVEIIDNFLEESQFEALERVMMYPHLPWYYQDRIDDDDEDGTKFMFCHLFYQTPIGVASGFMKNLDPLIERIYPLSLYRIKANCIPKTPEIRKNTFHHDMHGMSDRAKSVWTTAVLYMNTNNGYTELKDGTKIESIANRFVSWPANTFHRGTSCTDQNIRVIINLNYFAYEFDVDTLPDAAYRF